MKKKSHLLLLLPLLISCVGCGGGETQMPTGQLTEEQLEQVRQEDETIEDEEGGGGL